MMVGIRARPTARRVDPSRMGPDFAEQVRRFWGGNASRSEAMVVREKALRERADRGIFQKRALNPITTMRLAYPSDTGMQKLKIKKNSAKLEHVRMHMLS